MKKIVAMLTILLLAATTLTGCLERTELNKLGIVSGIGIDLEEDGYNVTVQILNPASLANNSSALPVYSLQAKGDSISEAFQRVDQQTATALFLPHLNVIVVNEKLAEEGINPVLNFALRHTNIRPDINILVAKETSANHILNVLTSVDTPPAGELDISTNMIFTHTARLVDLNLYEIVDMVNTDTTHVVLNAVSTQHENEQKHEIKDDGNMKNVQTITPNAQLRIEHLAVFKEDKIIGYLDDNQAQLYNILMDDHKRYVMRTTIEEEYYVVAEITQTSTKIKTDLANNSATIDIDLTAMIVENTYNIDLTTIDNLNTMAEHLGRQLDEDLHEFVNHIQQDLQTDILGIGGKAYYKEHHVWEEVQGYWEERFPELDITINLNFEIDAVGEIGNVTL